MKSKKTEGVLLDTSFFIRLLNENDPLCKQTESYYRYFLENHFELYLSTIAVAEYCVKGNIEQLPMKDIRILPFNLDHAVKAGILAGFVFGHKKRLNNQPENRNIIPNDSKLFAQADCSNSITYYASSDTTSQSIFDLLQDNIGLSFRFIDIHTPHSQYFGILDL